MRLDKYLFDLEYTESRTEAKKFIEIGAVSVNGKIIDKPSYNVAEYDEIKIDKSRKKYVSRGGLKLQGALQAFKVNVNGRLALDVGASCGGFTDCLLQNGTAHVISVDSGSGQIAEMLRIDKRVTVIENYNARYMQPSDFKYTPNLAVMDVSFISATYIMEPLYSVLADDADFICLIKPQFEVGKSLVGKGGIVKDEKSRKLAIDKVTSCAEALGFVVEDVIKSPIEGGDGNTEYLAHFRKRQK